MAFYGFFDSADFDHLELLHESVRSHSQLESTLKLVEAEVLKRFTRRNRGELDLGTGYTSPKWVYLDGYDQDVPLNSDDDLKEELRDTIARVLEWRLIYYSKDGHYSPSVQSVSLGDFSVTKKDGFDPRWPPGWDTNLRRLYSLLPETYVT